MKNWYINKRTQIISQLFPSKANIIGRKNFNSPYWLPR